MRRITSVSDTDGQEVQFLPECQCGCRQGVIKRFKEMDELCMAYKKQHIDLRANSCTMKEERYSLADIDELMEYM